MPAEFLHRHRAFSDLLSIVGQEHGIDPVLVEKDYWIMHCLHGLQTQGFNFELKGGTSLSKGFQIIDRFSEDLDIRIEPPEGLEVSTGRNHDKPKHVDQRRQFYDWLVQNLKIDGLAGIERAVEFDDSKLRSAGIRLIYEPARGSLPGLKEGVLLEVGFDDVTPNLPCAISSWAWDYAFTRGAEILDNRAVGVACYHPGYTLVEKLQTISTKFRKQQEFGTFPVNFLRHYYDIFRLLNDPLVSEFVGTKEYFTHKDRRFRGEEKDLTKNEAVLLNERLTFELYERAYNASESLYYRGRPSFEEIIEQMRSWAAKL